MHDSYLYRFRARADDYTEWFEEIIELFEGDLVLISKGMPQTIEEPYKGLQSFGRELQYKSPETADMLSVYIVVSYRENVNGHLYPVNFMVATDFESGRLNDVRQVCRGEEGIAPFLFIRSSPQTNKKRRYDEVSELPEGSSIRELTEVLDDGFPHE